MDYTQQQLETLSIVINDRTGVLFSGEVAAVSSTNELGTFDILGEHANMVTTITEKVILHKINKTTQEFKLNSGLLRVTKNHVEIYIGL